MCHAIEFQLSIMLSLIMEIYAFQLALFEIPLVVVDVVAFDGSEKNKGWSSSSNLHLKGIFTAN